MRNVVIVAGCRTPIGSLGGQFKKLPPVELSVPVMQELVKRANIDPAIIEECFWGCNYQRTYLENNLARVAVVKAGLPHSIPGITLHRNCTSSMSSIQLGFFQIMSGNADCVLAGGADSMSTAPHMVFDARYGKKYGHMEMRDSMWDSLTNLGVGPAMGITAENVAEKYGISREEQDTMAFESQQKACAAIDSGRFKEEIVPITIHDRRKGDIVIDTDENPKRNTTMEGLAKLKTVFKEDGTVTAGNASGMNDAASGVILMSEEKAKEVGAPILARVVSVATTGVDPDYMGIGPISAIRKALEKANLTIDDIDVFEINEAFAAQACACRNELGIPNEKLNVNGSGISLGHPVGATGARLVLTAMYELRKQNKRYAVSSLCAGGGMGTAVVIEAVK